MSAFAQTFWSATFQFSVAAIAYSYLCYPALLWLLSRAISRRPTDTVDRPSLARNGELPSVAVLVAAHDEEAHIANRIANVMNQVYPQERLLLYLGSDGSSDATPEIMRRHASARVRIHIQKNNGGKAAMLNVLAAQAREDILVFTDANTVFEPDAVRRLIDRLLQPGTACVSGRLILTSTSGDNPDSAYWRFEQFLKSAEGRIGGLLGANGGIYGMWRSRFRPIPADTIVDDFCLAMNAAGRGRELAYEPLAVATEATPENITQEFGRRVRIGIGNYQALFRSPQYLWRRGSTAAFTYVSHKVLRWLTPHFMVAALVSSVALWSVPPYRALALLQIGTYLAAFSCIVMRKHVRAPAPLRVICLFVVLNAAFLVGFWRYATGRYGGSWSRTARAEGA